jgi:aminoglycoside 3-N-acetyltransferase
VLTKQQIKDALINKGLRLGDHLLVHSSVKSVGLIDGGPDALIDALLEVVGDEGTLAMPAFNYTRPLPQPYFDVAITPSRAGALTEIYRQRPETLRSLHPSHSVAAQGKRAEEFLADHHKGLAFGVGSPVDRIAQAGGYVLLIGVTHMANSCIHIGESHAGVTKFYWENGPIPIAKLRMPNGKIIDHSLDCSSSCSMAFNSVEYPLRCKNMIMDLNVGEALSFLMRGKVVIETVVEMIRQRPDALFCNRSTCQPCIKGRQYLDESGLLNA